MALTKVCEADDLVKGQMAAFFVEGWEILVIRDSQGDLHALDGICPHEEYPLIYGELDEDVLVCAGHGWCFDVTTGDGLTQPGCRLAKYHVEVQGTEVYVDRDREPTKVPSTD
jgi:toluene monooxygenase system ferredoxin subunit